MKKSFQCRIAQLDLARQMETVEFIKGFIDLLAGNGYNLLLLYLEDRIITAHYQLPKPTEAYTEDQIRELVAYGAERGVELFPCVATLGHAERFLAHPELKRFAEVKEGHVGRFGGPTQNTFCVSEDGFYEFLFDYIRDVSALFPSPYFHVGLDEFWDFNLCPKCRAQAPDLRSEEQLFLKHILKVHEFLAGLGKRMVMWDDMFENYQDILEDVPRDVIMAHWQYQKDVRFTQAHFDNLTASDMLGRYEQLGFEVFASPCDMSLGNPVSYLSYVQGYSCVKGMLLTSWERSDTYWPRYFPVFAVMGRMFSGADQETAMRDSVQALFGRSDSRLVTAVEAAISQNFIRHFQTSSESQVFSRGYFGLDRGSYQTDRMIYEELGYWWMQVDRGREILQDLMEVYVEKMAGFKLKQACVDALDFGLTPERREEVVSWQKRYVALYERRAEEWSSMRPGIVPNVLAEKVPMLTKRMEDYLQRLDQGCFVKLRLMHADWYGMPRITLALKVQGAWQNVMENRVVKPEDLEQSLTDFYFVCTPEQLSAEAVRLEVTGFGGVGVAYVDLRRNGQTVRVPAKVLDTENTVENPQNMLTDNSCWCFFGSQNMRETYCHGELFDVRHRADLALKECDL